MIPKEKESNDNKRKRNINKKNNKKNDTKERKEATVNIL